MFFEVPMEAQPQPRPRARILGRPPFQTVPPIQIYTGSSVKVAAYKDAVKGAFSLAYPEQEVLKGPLLVELEFVFERPTTLLGQEESWHVYKPDLDNLAKGTLDALNGLAWEDDSQIVDLRLKKRFSGVALGGKSGRKRVPSEPSSVKIKFFKQE